MIYALMGPTATGKTDLAIRLAKKLNCDIISVDSAMIYRGMNIGTAKPTEEERQGVKHHLIDILDANASYSVALFVDQANALIQKNRENGKPSILVGGTMLYFNALLHGLSKLPRSEEKQRLHFQNILAEQGSDALFALLREKDPLSASLLHPKDHQRIIRALCVQQNGGKSRHDYYKEVHSFPYQYKAVAIVPQNREQHRQIIAMRFIKMLESGFSDEIERLRLRGDLTKDSQSIRAVGYRQWWQYLDGDYSRETAIEKTIIATSQLAKKQKTWLNRFPEVVRIETEGNDLNRDLPFKKILQHFL